MLLTFLASSHAGLELEKNGLLQIPVLLCRHVFGSNDQRIRGKYEDASFSTCQVKLRIGIRPDEQGIQI